MLLVMEQNETPHPFADDAPSNAQHRGNVFERRLVRKGEHGACALGMAVERLGRAGDNNKPIAFFIVELQKH